MSEFYDEKNESSPTYKLHRKETLLWVGVTSVVLVLSYFFIWQMKDTAVKKIGEEVATAKLSAEDGSKASQKIEAYEEIAETDPIGFDLSNFVHDNYHGVVMVVYFILTALTLAVIARFIAFLLITSKRRKYYPSDKDLESFLEKCPNNWDDYYSRINGMRHYGTAFWKVLKQSSTVINDSKKYDHLYLHMRNRFDKVIENISETALYESIATASPAAGFFGTLIGLLFIFTQSENGIAALTNSPLFAVGLKVAIITSLWGLLNLGAAIMFSYFTRKVTESIYDRMILKAFAICNQVERFDTKSVESEVENNEEVTYAGRAVNVGQ
jgi:biopolymer transport protein ExbB/TolQ